MNLLFMFIVSVNRGIMYRCCRRLAIVIKTKVRPSTGYAYAVGRNRQYDTIVLISHKFTIVIMCT